MKGCTPGRSDIVSIQPKGLIEKGRAVNTVNALVLSSREYNQQTGLLICCPISPLGRGGVTEVQVDEPSLAVGSVVVSNKIQSVGWKEDGVDFIGKADEALMERVLVRIIPLIGADKVVENFIS